MSTFPSPYQPLHDEGAEHPFVVLEGVSGVGKSTLRKLLVQRLGATGIHTLHRPHGNWSSHVNTMLRPLPQFAFYLSGALHASDAVRQARAVGPVVADRYVSSVIACHAAVHRIGLEHVAKLLEPFRAYLATPTHTFYLRCSEKTLRERLAGKSDRTLDDTELIEVPTRLERLAANFEAVARQDPTAVWLNTEEKTPGILADWIFTRLEAGSA
ncbi:dTMP kinase [Streptomyces anandii]|uniref:dTMP kinase n=1 Tax=Streptomyces anandii TaxID=285454 RepID=A0ABW6GZV1_9ACTN